MATQILRINPFDTFFFRDGKPFSAGDDTWADGIFPPSPSVIYGALRTAWISEQPDGFTEDNIKASEELKIKGIFLEFNHNTISIPVPRDFVYEKGQKDNKHYLNLELNRVKSICTLEMIAFIDKIVENFDKGYLLRKSSIGRYLSKEKNIEPKEAYILSESKIGIGRDISTHTTKESALYRVDMMRFIAGYHEHNENEDENAAIVVECEGLNFPKKSILKLGGEGKAAQYDIIENQPQYCMVEPPLNFSENRFRLSLITPSVFDNGWLPSWVNTPDFIGEYKGLKLKLLATVLGKPLSIGGFGYSMDSQRFEPKKMYKAIPAGSVYYFELLKGTFDEVKSLFHYQSISEQKANEGFGITYLGI